MAAALIAKSSTRAIVPVRAQAPKTACKARMVSAKVPARQSALVANTPAGNKFHVWNPTNNKMFETFSFLPPLTNDEVAMQVEYVIDNGWVPALEFSDGATGAYISNESCIRFGAVSVGYHDNRYWTMWKLPLFGCTDPDAVLKEVSLAVKAFPNAYVRLVAFDNIRQVQVVSFLVHRPASIKDWQPVDKRSVNPEPASSGGAPKRRSGRW